MFYKTPLLWAIDNNSIEMFRILIDKGADINFMYSSERWTPLHCAARNNSNADFVKILIEKDAKVDALDRWDQTPLH